MQSVYETRARDGHFAVESVTETVLSRHYRMTKAIKQAHNYLLIVHFDTRSSRNGKNPRSRGRLLTLQRVKRTVGFHSVDLKPIL
jgi:hypothetical protein